MEDEARDWMRSRPDSVKELMLRFPPGCKVMADGMDLRCPAPNKVARIVSYLENGTFFVHPEDDPDDPIKYQVQPDWVKVVGFFTDDDGDVQDHEWVKRVLEV